MPDLPTLFDSEEDALAMGAEFREHVENVVRGNRPRRTMAVSATQPSQFEKSRRAARLIQRRVRSWREQWKLEARLKRDMCRREFQIYRTALVALLQEHITKGTTISLLREPPTKTMKVSPHVREKNQKKATMVMLFLKYMQIRDADRLHFKVGGKHASDMAAKVGDLLGTNKKCLS